MGLPRTEGIAKQNKGKSTLDIWLDLWPKEIIKDNFALQSANIELKKALATLDIPILTIQESIGILSRPIPAPPPATKKAIEEHSREFTELTKQASGLDDKKEALKNQYHALEDDMYQLISHPDTISDTTLAAIKKGIQQLLDAIKQYNDAQKPIEASLNSLQKSKIDRLLNDTTKKEVSEKVAAQTTLTL